MTKIGLTKIAIAVSTFACAGLLSVSWSEQRGVSLSVESAQARIGHPLTPLSGAGVARRHYRRAAYGYGAGVVGAGLAAGAIGAAAVAATSPGYYGGGPYVGTGWGYPGGYTSNYYGGYGYPGGYYGGYANRSYVTGRPTLIPRYYGGYAAGNYYCSYGVGCGYGADNYYASYNMPGFPASFYGVYGGYSDGYYGRYVNRRFVTGRPTLVPRY